jgi:predicted ArsR family transcriptional regulator
LGRVTAAVATSSRARVLATLRAADRPLRVEEICRAVGLSRHAVRSHLVHLTQTGEIRDERLPPRGRGRPGSGFRAVPAEAVDDGAAYRTLARLLSQALHQVASASAAEQAGLTWATEILPGPVADPDPAAAVRRVVTLLDDYGFAPRVEGDRVALHRCPYLDVARDQPDVVCGLHVGLVRGLLGASAGGLRVQLDPTLDGSGPCVLSLVPVADAGDLPKESCP